jgi:hypothetical protein
MRIGFSNKYNNKPSTRSNQMKRLVILAGVLAVSTAAQAQDAEFKHSGEFRVRYYNDMTPSGIKDQPGNKNDIEGRMKFGLTMNKGPGIKAHVGLLHNSVFGTDRGTNHSDEMLPSNSYQTFAAYNSLLVNEAYGWMALSPTSYLKVGRFQVEHGGGEFLSTDDHKAVPITHEGFLYGLDTDFAAIGVGLVRNKELPVSAGKDSDPEQHEAFAVADFKNMPEALKTVSLAVGNIARSESGAAVPGNFAANIQVLGLTLGGETAGFNYRFVYGSQMGTAAKSAAVDLKMQTSMMDVTFGYSMPETMGLKVWANYHTDSGDDNAADDKFEEYQKIHYNSHKFAGLMDIFGWGNLTYWNVNAEIAPAEDMTVGLGLYGFSKTKENSTTLKGANNDRFAAFRGGAAAGKADLGMELDVYATKKYANGFKVDALIGAFMPGAAFKDATTKRDATIMQAMLTGTMSF